MGLIEKRLIRSGQQEWVPEAQKELRELTRSEVVYEIDWDGFQSDEAALNNLANQALRRINSAFRVVCSDDLGQEAVKEQIAKVVVKNVSDPAKKGLELKDKAFTFTAALGKGDAGYFADNDIIKFLQRAL
jgi:hypothetical protein